MYKQFNKEPFVQLPNPKKQYFCSENVTSDGFTYLMKLIFLTIKNPKLIDKIKDYKNEINNTNSKGWSALMIVCRNSEIIPIRTIKELISLGADVHKQTSIGNNALMLMCLEEKINLQAFREVIKYTDVNKQNQEGNNALMILCKENHATIELVKELINAGIDVNKQNYDDMNALMLYCKTRYINFNRHIVKKLIEAGTYINTQASEGWSVLMMVCLNKNIDAVYELINAGANVNVMNHTRRTPLLIYISGIFLEANNDKTIDILIENDYLTFNCKTNIKELLDFNCHKITRRLYDMYKCNKDIMVKILPKLKKEEQMNWYKFIVDITRINENILKHRKFIYEQPYNIISMCGQVLFSQKQNIYDVPDKLKFLFDIKSENDCLSKIKFYL